MDTLGWKYWREYQGLQMEEELWPDDWYRDYAYSLIYVENILVFHNNSKWSLKEIDHLFKMNPSFIGDIDLDIIDKIRPSYLTNGVAAWGVRSRKYIWGSVKKFR